ncbi:hypothetical protein HCB69_15930 [Listeria booriae]|uniref:Uncharacterized protein n=1 Tax=Listeria booriae TaxID=1552123 RepID=A0A842FJ09_9LIST|nr:hypothetical protein [Listeria booriae]MBC2285865.1 hypothetical protein [Listeria booriae]
MTNNEKIVANRQLRENLKSAKVIMTLYKNSIKANKKKLARQWALEFTQKFGARLITIADLTLTQHEKLIEQDLEIEALKKELADWKGEN